MLKVMRMPPRSAFRSRERFPGGFAFMILMLVSILLWAGIIHFVA